MNWFESRLLVNCLLHKRAPVRCNTGEHRLFSIHEKTRIRCLWVTNEGVKKIKFRLGLIGDSFYSFKDDLEQELAEIYRILKDLEEKTNHE